VCVANAAALVGKTVKVKVERVLPGLAYASLVERAKAGDEPLTAESLAEKPTRAPAKKKATDEAVADVDGELVDEAVAEDLVELDEEDVLEDDDVLDGEEPDEDDEPDEDEDTAVVGEDGVATTPKKRTRRGSRGGRRRRKPAGAAGAAAATTDGGESVTEDSVEDETVSLDEQYADAEAPAVERTPRPPRPPRQAGPRIHVPDEALGREDDDEDDVPVSANGEPPADGEAPPRKRTRRGSRGGKRRRKPAGATAEAGVETAIAEAIVEPTTTDGP
jgi:ribonuclease E